MGRNIGSARCYCGSASPPQPSAVFHVTVSFAGDAVPACAAGGRSSVRAFLCWGSNIGFLPISFWYPNSLGRGGPLGSDQVVLAIERDSGWRGVRWGDDLLVRISLPRVRGFESGLASGLEAQMRS